MACAVYHDSWMPEHPPQRMRVSIDELEAQAMRLSLEERLSLSERLLSSLDTGLEFEAEWAEEADRRVEEMRGGAVEMIPGDDIFRRALGRRG